MSSYIRSVATSGRTDCSTAARADRTLAGSAGNVSANTVVPIARGLPRREPP
jgi:hypothetical protein